jgi:hypothetical protein
MNYHLKKVIGDNETGFVGTNNFPYRREGWNFILAGGGLYNNLDYSFTVGHEDGTFVYPAKQPGGGNPAFRREMRILKEFIHSFDFVRMQPQTNLARGLANGFSGRALAEEGKAYAIYISHDPKRVAQGTNSAATSTPIEVDVPSGRYRVEWLHTRSGRTMNRERRDHGGGTLRLTSPDFTEDIALKITR